MMAKKNYIPIFTLVRSFLEDFQESVRCPPLGQEAQRIMSKVRPATTRTLRNCSSTKSNILVQIAQRVSDTPKIKYDLI